MTDKNISIKNDGQTLFAEANPDIHDQIRHLSAVDDLNAAGGSIEVCPDGRAKSMGVVTYQGSGRDLAPGELEVRTLADFPAGDLSKANPDQLKVVIKGMAVSLSQAVKLGLVEVNGNSVKERRVERTPTQSTPVKPVNLGEGWDALRRAKGSASVDNNLASVMAAVSRGERGESLDAVLKNWSESMSFGFTDGAQIRAAYNEVANRFHASMAQDLEAADARMKPGEGFDVLNHALKLVDADTRTSILIRKLHGDQSWLPQLKGVIDREIRRRQAEKGSKK